MTSAGSSGGWARVIVDVASGVATGVGDSGIAARASGFSDAPGKTLFFGVFLAGEGFFFFFLAGLGDFFLAPALRFAGEGSGDGDFLGFAVGVGVGVDLPLCFVFRFVDLALGEGVGLIDSARGVLEGSLVCA